MFPKTYEVTTKYINDTLMLRSQTHTFDRLSDALNSVHKIKVPEGYEILSYEIFVKREMFDMSKL